MKVLKELNTDIPMSIRVEDNDIGLFNDKTNSLIFGIALSDDPEGKLLEGLSYSLDNQFSHFLNEGYSDGFDDGYKEHKKKVSKVIMDLIE